MADNEDGRIIGDYEKILDLTSHLAEAFDKYIASKGENEVSFMIGMMGVLNLAKRVANETDRQAQSPDGYWRRMFVLNFLRMMAQPTYDTQDPTLAELAGLPPDEFWQVIESVVENGFK